jgi:hypothetical protein
MHLSDTGEKWEYRGTKHELVIDFKKSCDSVRRKVLYNILTKFSTPVKLVRLSKMCLSETYIKFHIGKHLSDVFPIQNGLKQKILLPLLFNFPSGYTIRKSQENKEGLELNGRHQLVISADDVNLLGKILNIIKENKEALLNSSNENGLEVNAEKTKYGICLCLITRQQEKFIIYM